MMPIGDDNTGNTLKPYINYALIAINVLVFIFFQRLGSDEAFTLSYAAVPQEIITGKDIIGPNGLLATPIPVWETIFTAMFMHGSIAHISGNMLYLWIFGDNLENRMGHLRYLIFYLVCGVLATLSHVYLSDALGKDTLIPSLGASGAISGVLGGYLLLFPRNKVRVLAFRYVMTVPAIVSLGIWILLQIISGMSMFGGEGSQGGVAYAAHIGGFIAGLVLVKLFARKVKPII